MSHVQGATDVEIAINNFNSLSTENY